MTTTCDENLTKPFPKSERTSTRSQNNTKNESFTTTERTPPSISTDANVPERSTTERKSSLSLRCGRRPLWGSPDALYAPPLPTPTDWKTDHFILPILTVILSYYIDEGVGLVMTSSLLLGPLWYGGATSSDGLIPIAFPNTSARVQRWIYASYIASYAILQFLTSPSMGAASDVYGRKRIISLCAMAWVIASILQAGILQYFHGIIDVQGATLTQQQALSCFIALLVGRLIRGLFGGITGCVKAAISDVGTKLQAQAKEYENKQESINKSHTDNGDDPSVVPIAPPRPAQSRASFFVYFGFTVGLGRLIGVIAGSWGSRSFGYAMPYWLIMAVDIVAVAYIASPLFHETRPDPAKESKLLESRDPLTSQNETTSQCEGQNENDDNNGTREKDKARLKLLNPLRGFRFLIFDVWKSSFEVVASLVVLFTFRVAWMLFANYLQVYLADTEGLQEGSEIERLELIGKTWTFGMVGYLGLEWGVNQPLTRIRFPSVYILMKEFTVQGALVLAATYARTESVWYATIIPAIALNAFGTPNSMSLVSSAAPPDQAGLIMGSASALKSFSYAFAALLTGVSIQVDLLWYIVVGLFWLAAILCYVFMAKGVLKDTVATESTATNTELKADDGDVEASE